MPMAGVPENKKQRSIIFRGIASRIIAKDRFLRKRRHNVDTGGEIVRALERAYQFGLNTEHTSTLDPNSEPIDIGLLHRGPLNVFIEFCRAVIGDVLSAPCSPYTGQLMAENSEITSKKFTRWEFWRCANPGEPFPPWSMIIEGRSVSHKMVAPLIDLGLLDIREASPPTDEDKEGTPASLWISERGEASWSDYLSAHPNEQGLTQRIRERNL